MELRSGGDPWPEQLDGGEPMTMQLHGAEIGDVMRVLAQITGCDVAVAPGVSGKVTVELRDVPLRRALDVLMWAGDLGYFFEDGILHVVPRARLSGGSRLLASTTAALDRRQPEPTTLVFPHGPGSPAVALLVEPLAGDPGERITLPPGLRGVGEVRRALREAAAPGEHLVILRAVAGADGSLSDLEVLGAPSAELDRAVAATASTWRFEPPLGSDGRPRPVVVGFGLRLEAPSVVAPPERYDLRITLEPAPAEQRTDGRYVVSLYLYDLDSGELVSAPRVALEPGKPSQVKSGFVTPDGREHSFVAEVTADPESRSASCSWRVTSAGRVVASVSVDLRL